MMTDDMTDRLLTLMSGSSWLSFVGEVLALIEAASEPGEAWDMAVKACPSLEHSVPEIHRMLLDMHGELARDVARYAKGITEAD